MSGALPLSWKYIDLFSWLDGSRYSFSSSLNVMDIFLFHFHQISLSISIICLQSFPLSPFSYAFCFPFHSIHVSQRMNIFIKNIFHLSCYLKTSRFVLLLYSYSLLFTGHSVTLIIRCGIGSVHCVTVIVSEAHIIHVLLLQPILLILLSLVYTYISALVYCFSD